MVRICRCWREKASLAPPASESGGGGKAWHCVSPRRRAGIACRDAGEGTAAGWMCAPLVVIHALDRGTTGIGVMLFSAGAGLVGGCCG